MEEDEIIRINSDFSDQDLFYTFNPKQQILKNLNSKEEIDYLSNFLSNSNTNSTNKQRNDFIELNAIKSLEIAIFPKKLYQTIQNPKNSHLITWLKDGKNFIIIDKEKFAQEILSTDQCSKGTFESFVKQLSNYNFTREKDSKFLIYSHAYFVKGRPDLLCKIQRKKYGSYGSKKSQKDNSIEEQTIKTKNIKKEKKEGINNNYSNIENLEISANEEVNKYKKPLQVFNPISINNKNEEYIDKAYGGQNLKFPKVKFYAEKRKKNESTNEPKFNEVAIYKNNIHNTFGRCLSNEQLNLIEDYVNNNYFESEEVKKLNTNNVNQEFLNKYVNFLSNTLTTIHRLINDEDKEKAPSIPIPSFININKEESGNDGCNSNKNILIKTLEDINKKIHLKKKIPKKRGRPPNKQNYQICNSEAPTLKSKIIQPDSKAINTIQNLIPNFKKCYQSDSNEFNFERTKLMDCSDIDFNGYNSNNNSNGQSFNNSYYSYKSQLNSYNSYNNSYNSYNSFCLDNSRSNEEDNQFEDFNIKFKGKSFDNFDYVFSDCSSEFVNDIFCHKKKKEKVKDKKDEKIESIKSPISQISKKSLKKSALESSTNYFTAGHSSIANINKNIRTGTEMEIEQNNSKLIKEPPIHKYYIENDKKKSNEKKESFLNKKRRPKNELKKMYSNFLKTLQLGKIKQDKLEGQILELHSKNLQLIDQNKSLLEDVDKNCCYTKKLEKLFRMVLTSWIKVNSNNNKALSFDKKIIIDKCEGLQYNINPVKNTKTYYESTNTNWVNNHKPNYYSPTQSNRFKSPQEIYNLAPPQGFYNNNFQPLGNYKNYNHNIDQNVFSMNLKNFGDNRNISHHIHHHHHYYPPPNYYHNYNNLHLDETINPDNLSTFNHYDINCNDPRLTLQKKQTTEMNNKVENNVQTKKPVPNTNNIENNEIDDFINKNFPGEDYLENIFDEY